MQNSHEIDHQRQNPELHYNFVFFFARDDYWKAILGKEVYDSPNVHIYQEAFESGVFLQKLFKIHWAYRINRKIKLPFKAIWFKRMYTQQFTNDLPLCFIYMGGNNIYADGGFSNYVRRKNKKNRQVILHNDLIAKKCNYDYSIIRNKVDLATTYDLSEAQKYNIHYFREDTYSKIIELPDEPSYDCDVYFLGAAKDRLNEIMDVYFRLTESGLRCKFIITGVKDENKVKSPGLFYSNGITYKENIKNVISCRCVLEIIQKGSMDITTRALEAIAYQRKFLTNCQVVPENYYNEGQLQVFKAAKDIDIMFLKDNYDQKDFPPCFDMNPYRRLYDIQEQLEE